MPYGDIELGQYWLRYWLVPGSTKPLPEPIWLLIRDVLWHQLGINFKASAQAILFCTSSLMIILLKLPPHPPGPNELCPDAIVNHAWCEPNLVVLFFFHSRIFRHCTSMVNSLGPSDTIWHWRSWSTLVQVMACCLTTPSHYLNQCWLIISKVLLHSSGDINIRRFDDINQ